MRVRACLALLATLVLLAEQAVVAAHTHAADESSPCGCRRVERGPAWSDASAHDHDRCAICELAPPVVAPPAFGVDLPPSGRAPVARAQAHEAPALRLERRLPPARGPPAPSRFA